MALGLGGLNQRDIAQSTPLELDVVAKGFPHRICFRQAESEAASGRSTYEQWESRYLPLGGILGKVLNEAHDYTGQNNREWFLRYKA